MSYDDSFSTNTKIKPCTCIYTVVVCANRFIVGYETVYVEKLHVGILLGFSQILECAVSFNLFFPY